MHILLVWMKRLGGGGVYAYLEILRISKLVTIVPEFSQLIFLCLLIVHEK